MLQPPVQELLRVGMHQTNVSQFLAPDDPRVLLAHRGRVRLGVLPIQALMTGRSYCLQRLDKVTTCCHRAGNCFYSLSSIVKTYIIAFCCAACPGGGPMPHLRSAAPQGDEPVIGTPCALTAPIICRSICMRLPVAL